MTNQLETTLGILERAMALAHHAILEGPVHDEYLIGDLCSMLAALDTLVRDYRDALADLNGEMPF